MVLWMLPCSWNSMTLALWKMLLTLMGVLKRMVVCMSVLSLRGGVCRWYVQCTTLTPVVSTCVEIVVVLCVAVFVAYGIACWRCCPGVRSRVCGVVTILGCGLW